MNRLLQKLIKLSNTAGSNQSLVLGSFGNTSVKTADEKYMYIKASGTALKDMNRSYGWRRLRTEPLLAILADKTVAKKAPAGQRTVVTNRLICACDDKTNSEFPPSVESCFHSILDRWVVHVHPLAVLAYACSKNGRAEIERLFKQQRHPPMWVPYTDIGYKLAVKIRKLANKYELQHKRRPKVIFLQNHGLIAAAGDADTVLRLVRTAVKRCGAELKLPQKTAKKKIDNKKIIEAASVIGNAVSRVCGKHMMVKYFSNKDVSSVLSAKNIAQLCSAAAVTPDELVYLNGGPLRIRYIEAPEITARLNRRIKNGFGVPVVFLVDSLGLFIVQTRYESGFLEKAAATSLLVRRFAAGLGGIRPLNRRQRQFIAYLM